MNQITDEIESDESLSHIKDVVRKLSQTELPWVKDGKLDPKYRNRELFVDESGRTQKIGRVGFFDKIITWNDFFKHSQTVPDRVHVSGSFGFMYSTSHTTRNIMFKEEGESINSLFFEVVKYYLSLGD